LSLRVRLDGGRVVVARDAFLHHKGSRTFTALGVDYATQMARNQEVFGEKWRDGPAWAALCAAQRGDIAGAGALARAARARHPRWLEGELFAARAAHAEGDAERACRHAERFVAACPASWQGRVVHVLALLA